MKVGDHVKEGQTMALIGASGDAREPHLHFEIANSPKALAGEGLPYVIDHYRVKSEKGWEADSGAAVEGYGDRFRAVGILNLMRRTQLSFRLERRRIGGRITYQPTRAITKPPSVQTVKFHSIQRGVSSPS